jgi:hypothetical protein
VFAQKYWDLEPQQEELHEEAHLWRFRGEVQVGYVRQLWRARLYGLKYHRRQGLWWFPRYEDADEEQVSAIGVQHSVEQKIVQRKVR